MAPASNEHIRTLVVPETLKLVWYLKVFTVVAFFYFYFYLVGVSLCDQLPAFKIDFDEHVLKCDDEYACIFVYECICMYVYV